MRKLRGHRRPGSQTHATAFAGHRSAMTQEPEPTQPIDMSKVLEDAREDSDAQATKAVDGEPRSAGETTDGGS